MRIGNVPGITCDGEPFLARVTTDESMLRNATRVLLESCDGKPGVQMPALLEYNRGSTYDESTNEFQASLLHPCGGQSGLADGDVVAIDPGTRLVSIPYKARSIHNSMVITERCNCNCIMCPQPPLDRDACHLVRMWTRVIGLMDDATPLLGITGGEPTMEPESLRELLRLCRDRLPNTDLQVLSNGRMFNYLPLSQDIAALRHARLVVGVPLYSDMPHIHDHVVQADGAFDQTIRGLINMARCGLRVELRFVVCRQTVGRLPEWARFVGRNLPFVEHVALMGLELMGYAKANANMLWSNPQEHQAGLLRAVDALAASGIATSIYNYPLCCLSRDLWPFAAKSISEWKAHYFVSCGYCRARAECGGMFISSKDMLQPSIHPC